VWCTCICVCAVSLLVAYLNKNMKGNGNFIEFYLTVIIYTLGNKG